MSYADSVVAMIDTLDPLNHTGSDVVACCLHANALLDRPTAALADHLWDLRISWSSHAGWGTPEYGTRDAFADQTTNPADTIYGFPTCRGALALQAAGDERADEIAESIVSPMLWDGVGVDYSTEWANDGGYRVWNICGMGLWVLAQADRFPAHRASLRSILEDAQGDGASVPAWHWEYMQGSNTKNDVTHLSFIARGLQVAGSSAADAVWSNLHRFHAGSGKTKEHDSSGSAVTSHWHPGWHLAMTVWGGQSWGEAVADDIVASLSDGVSSYRRDGSFRGDRDQAHILYGLAEYAASVS